MNWKERLDKLLPYYIECVKEDGNQGATAYHTDEGNKFISLPSSIEWSTSNYSYLSFDIATASNRFLMNLRKSKGSGALFYGYPLYVDWRTTANWTGGIIVPVFFIPVSASQSGNHIDISTDDIWPRVNGEFTSRVLKHSEERRNFLHDVGLLDSLESNEEINIAFLAKRLASLNIVEQIEEINPDNLVSTPSISGVSQKGLYNRGVFILGEKSKFTAGLEKELELIKTTQLHKSDNSILKCFFDSNPISQNNSSLQNQNDIVEVVGLNDEQRAVAESAFVNPLTVATGPPGTGKSQIVVTILANAYLKGQRVLFTSRNNQAVDVVETRLNGLCNNPLVLRVGSKSKERDLKQQLLNYLTQLLSISTSDEDKQYFNEASEKYQLFINRRKELWSKYETLRNLRNRVDLIDQMIDEIKIKYDPETISRLYDITIKTEEINIDSAMNICKYHYQPTGGIIENIKRRLRKNKDKQYIYQFLKYCKENKYYFYEPHLPDFNNWNWSEIIMLLDSIKNWFETKAVINEYGHAINDLKSSSTPELFAQELSQIEENLWEYGGKLISGYGKLVSERIKSNPSIRMSIAGFKATIERLTGDRLGGKQYAQLMTEQKRLFKSISTILPIWCVTNLSARGTLPFEPGMFDLVVIDEASQCDIPSAIPILFRAKRALIIGDPAQLKHVSGIDRQRGQLIDNNHSLNSGEDQIYTYINNSLFDLAAANVSTNLISLREHFRSHAKIVAFSNKTWYRNSLKVCTDYRKLTKVPNESPGMKWTQINGKTIRPTGGGVICMAEVNIVVEQLENLILKQHFPGTIGIVTPFRAQVNRLKDIVYQKFDMSVLDKCDMYIDTAHGFQGDERDIIIFSPCVQEDLHRGAKYFLASTGNLFNVAITRARTLLNIVGDQFACATSGIPHIMGFAEYVHSLEKNVVPPQYEQPKWDDPRIGFWEKPFYDALVKAGLKPMSQYAVDQYRLDFALVNDNIKLDIEIDGEYYHREWDGTRCREDVMRDLRLIALGWTVKRFWVYRIRDEMDQCVKEVLDLVSNIH